MPPQNDPYRQAELAQRAAEDAIADQQRTAEKQAKQAAREQKAAADAARKAELSRQELDYRAQGMIPVTTADGNLHPDPLWEQKQAEKAAKTAQEQQAAQLSDQFAREGRKSFVSKVTGLPVALESDEHLAAQKQAKADATRKAALNERITALETAASDPTKKRLPLTAREKLAKQLDKTRQEALFGLQSTLQEQAKAVSGGNDYIPFNEAPTPEAKAAQERLARLSQPDADLTDDDLALLEANDATKPTVQKLRNIQSILAQDDEAAKFHDTHAASIFDLKLRRDDPAKWAEQVKARRASMTPQELQADLEASAADLQTRSQELQAKAAPIQQRRALTAQKLDTLARQAAERRQRGLMAGEIVTFTRPDGSTEDWPADLAAAYEREVAMNQEAETQEAATLEQLQALQADLQAEAALHDEGAATLTTKTQEQQQTAKTQFSNRLRFTPGMENAANEIDALQSEAETRKLALADMYPEGAPPEAIDALNADVQAKAEQAIATGQARLNSAMAAYGDIQAQLRANPDLNATAGDLFVTARQQLAQAAGISESEAKRLLDDAALLDWDQVTADEMNAGLVAESWKSGKNMTQAEDSRKTRLLSNGAVIVHPSITDEKGYTAAVAASGATPDAQAEAIARYPQIRAAQARTTLETIQEVQSVLGPDSLTDWENYTDWQKKKPADVDEAEWALRWTEANKAKNTGILGTLLSKTKQFVGNIAAGGNDLRQQASGILAGITGSETLMQDAQWAARKAQAQGSRLELGGHTSDNFLTKGIFDQLPRLSTSLVPAVGGAKAAQTGVRLFAGTKLGARFLPSLAAALETAATPAQAAKAISTLTRAGLGGAATAGAGQSYGAQLADIYGTLRKEHPELDHSTALRQAQMPAVVSGLATALLTVGFGSTGISKLITRPAEAKAAASKVFESQMKRMGFAAEAFVSGGFMETVEETLDEGISQVAAAIGKGQPVQQALGDFFRSLPEMAVATMIMGGAGEGVSSFRESTVNNGQQQSTTVNPANLPEVVATAESAIDALQIPDADEATLARTQDAARGVLYIAQGTPLTDLDADTLAALDIVEDPQKPGTFINGRIIPGKNGVPELQEYKAGMAPGRADDPSSAARPVRVRMIDGQPVISQQTLDKLSTLIPAVRAAIPLDEKQRLTQLQQPAGKTPAGSPPAQPAAAQSAPVDAGSRTAQGPVQNPPVQGPQPSPSGQPAPQSGAPVSNAGRSARSSGNPGLETSNLEPAAQQRSTELATLLESRGLTAPQALAAAQAVVARQGIVGASAEEQYAAGIDDEMFKLGWVKPQTRKKYEFFGRGTPPTSDAPSEATAVTPSSSGEAAKATAVTPVEDAADPFAAPSALRSPPSASDLADRIVVAKQRAMKAVPVASRKRFLKFITPLSNHLGRFQNAFPGGIVFTDGKAKDDLNYTGAGIAVANATSNPRMEVNLAELFKSADHLEERDLGSFTRRAVMHEVRHLAALKVITPDQARALWKDLPPALQARVYASYFAADIAAAHGKVSQKQLLTLAASSIENPASSKLPSADPFHMAHEFLRMLDEDAEFAGQTSEAMDANPSLGQAILDFLRSVLDEIKRLIATDLDQSTRVQLREFQKLVEAARKKLLSDNPADRLGSTQQSAAPLTTAADNRASVLSGKQPSTTANNRQPPQTAFAPVLGASGTAFTDSNDAIEFQWAVVDVNSLNVSNDDSGRINPDYPQELQPRDRTSAASEAQVNDIAKNFNLDRLSASSSVGDGAPIIGQDAVVESGNGRVMGARRAHTTGKPSASTYRAALIARAAEFGLNQEQVEAVPNPVLVRVRTTEVNRTAFVLAANVSTIAPKREMEQAKIDAKQIVPDLFDSFVPSEDGDIFTAANADFIRGFISAIVPPAERGQVIDASGNLSQTGLRRIRNALFVHAYGTSPEALNALGRLTESIDATDTGLARSLLAMAPRFAEQNARIANGALYPFSITENLAQALQKLADLRARGEKVETWLQQDRIPGIGDDPGPVTTALVEYLHANRQRPRQILDTLDRYAKALDSAGDPRQISLFGDEKPDAQTLWKLAANYKEPVLAKASTTVQPPSTTVNNRQLLPHTALRIYRKLTAQQASGTPLTPPQSQALERAERSLGQLFLFDEPNKTLKPAEDLVLESDSLPSALRSSPAEQLRLFKGRTTPDPRLMARFGENWPHGWDANGFPNMPRPLPDDSPLLEPTLDKKTARLQPDHPLVLAGLLPADRDIPRKALHQKIVEFFMRDATPLPEGTQPTLYAMGGGGGAGKSTILNILKRKGGLDTSNAVHINADDIKELIPEYHELKQAGDGRAAATVHEESSRLSNNLMDRAIPPGGKGRYNVVFDGTLSNGPKSLKLIARWRAAGLRVHLIAVTIDPREAVTRAVMRGADSGRWVPGNVLVQAHEEFNAAVKSYLPEVDVADIYDNTPPEPHQIAQKTTREQEVSIVNPEYWSIIDRRSHEALAPHLREGNQTGAGSAAGRGQTPLREVQSQSQGSRSPGTGTDQGPLTLAKGRTSPDAGPDLFGFNTGLGLDTLLTPRQKEAKLQQSQQLDLFGGFPDAPSRPTSQRPARPVTPPRSQTPAQQPAGFGDLFAQPGLAGESGGVSGTTRPAGQSGSLGTRGNDTAGGGLVEDDLVSTAGQSGIRGGGTVPGGNGGAGNNVSSQPARLDRPALDNPARNFSPPADLERLAPAGAKAKIRANLDAIKLLKVLDAAGRDATPEDKRTLAAYSGWGAFKEAFNDKSAEGRDYWKGRPDTRYKPTFVTSWEQNWGELHDTLKAELTEDEYRAASRSTLNAHYTAAPVIRAMWSMVERLGFKGGRSLEPSAGAGHYIGLQPAGDIADRTQWQTVELDDLSAKILARLYPEASVNERPGGNPARQIDGLGFERARIPNGSLDLVISNVPFHESGPRKKGFPNLNLHNFFFAHALDKVKPGGLVAFITSSSTMQNNQKQRDFIASKGDLVAAFRLPNNAFKENAGTEVVTDILLMRKPDGTPFKGEPWRSLVEVGRQTITLTQGKEQTAEELRREAKTNGEILREYDKNGVKAIDVDAPILVNEYFANHPEHVLGAHSLQGSMYRGNEYTVTAPSTLDVGETLSRLADTLPENVMGTQAAAGADRALAGYNDRPFSFKEQDGKIYEVQDDGSMQEAEWSTNPAMVKTFRSWLRVKDAVRELIEAEGNPSATDASLAPLRRNLNIAYDTHVGTHGYISRRFGNKHTHLYSDPEYPLTAALENEKITTDTKTGKRTYTYPKATIMQKRVMKPIAEPTSAKDIQDAIEKSLAWRGMIIPRYMADLLGTDTESVFAQLDAVPDIFEDPATNHYEHAETYLTGNIRTKLDAAEEAALDNPKFKKNADALAAVMPERRTIAAADPSLGERWIPGPVYDAFIREILGGNDKAEYIAAGNMWRLDGTHLYRNADFDTDRMGSYEILDHALSLKEPMIYDRDSEGRSIFNPTATAAAKASLTKMRRAFADFVKTSETLVEPPSTTANGGEADLHPSQTLPVWKLAEDTYNETMNNFVTPKQKGDYLQFPGLSEDVWRTAHRRAVIARFIAERRGMMAHGVGSGKTFNLIILSKELRRLGLAKKPLIVVQNSTLGQFAASYLQAYPSARILVPTERDLQTHNRRKLVSKIATGSYDAVILSQSQFDLISNKPESVRAYMGEKIDELKELILRAKGGDKSKVRDLEGMLKRLEDRLSNMLDALKGRQDSTIYFEDLGVDALIVDEAHNYKSIPIVTRMGRVKGVPSGADSQRAIGMLLKARHVQSKTGGKNVFLATGTPVKNSMAEAYIMMDLMAPDVLADYKIHNFDDFATAYGEITSSTEISWSGAPKVESRFAKFKKGRELITMIRSVFDVAMGNDKLGLKVPKVKGGSPSLDIVPVTPTIERFNAWVRTVADRWATATGKEKEEFTAVPIMTLQAGIVAALDPRLLAPGAPDHAGSKVNTAVRDILRLYHEGTPKKTTQLVFADLRRPFNMEYLSNFAGHPFPEYGGQTSASADGFDLYEDIKKKLIAGGVPEKEILLMDPSMSKAKRTAMFEKVSSGEIRIAIGSTETLGVGVNVQERLKALHHLMPPRDFTPAMHEQRNGRAIRQGNLHYEWGEEIEVHQWGTEGSMDSAVYGTLGRKQRFITQLLMGEIGNDSFDDPTDPIAVNLAEMAARTMGDPDFIRRIEIEKELRDLRLESDAFTSELSSRRSRLSAAEFQMEDYPKYISGSREKLAKLSNLWTRNAARPEGVKETTDITDKPVYEFGGRVIDTAAKEGGILTPLDLWLADASKTMERRGLKQSTGLPLTINGHEFTVQVETTMPGSQTPGTVNFNGESLGSFNGAEGLVRRLREVLPALRTHIDQLERLLENSTQQAASLRELLARDTTFSRKDELDALETELQAVDARLAAKAAPPVSQSPGPQISESSALPPLKPVNPNLLTAAVRDVLEQSWRIGTRVFLPDNLDRKLYERVNAALESVGGKWNKKAKAHLFSADPSQFLGITIEDRSTGSTTLAKGRTTVNNGQPSQTIANAAEGGYTPTSYADAAPDPFTGIPSLITGQRLPREQGRAIGHAHAQRLRAGLSSRPDSGNAGSALAASRAGTLNVGQGSADTPVRIPVLSAPQFSRLQKLPLIGEGAEAKVYADRQRGTVYKVLQGYAPVPGLIGSSALGVWPQVYYTAAGQLDYAFAPADRPRQLVVRLAVQTLVGGTPTEIVGIGPDGHIILKQPLSPAPEIGRDNDFIDNSGLSIARNRAGLVEIPKALLADPQSPRVFLAVVEGRPWLLMDLHPDNFVGDNQAQGRINDAIVSHLPASIIAKVPGLAQLVRDAAQRAQSLGDRSDRLFKASTAVNPVTPVNNVPPSPLARLGWNHLDRHLSAKLAALARWTDGRTGATQTVAKWAGAAPQKLREAAHALQREFFPDTVLPREILARKREMEIKTAMGSQRAMDLVRALSSNPKFSDIAYPPGFAENPLHRRHLYEAMTGERDLATLPKPLQDLAARLRAILVETGREAVKQGRMSTETFDNLRSTYMPHFYEEDVQKEKSLFQRFRVGVRDILAQRTTAWHIEDTSQKDSTGQFRLVSHSGNQWRFRNKEHMDAFFEDFIQQQALGELQSRYGKKFRSLTAADLMTPSKLDPEVRGRLQEIKRTLHQRYKRQRPLTIAEQEKAGLIMDPVYAIARYTAQMAHDNSTAEFFNHVASQPALVSDIATPGFTEIPDNPRFGRLAGKFVQDDVAGQLLELIEAPGIALKLYDTVLGWWKTGKTVLNPGTHVRNVLGNIFFSQLAGNSVWNPGNVTYYREALKALRNGGPVLTEAYDAGVLGADFVSAELRQTLRQLLPDPATIVDDGKAPTLLMGMGKAIGKYIGSPAGKTFNKITALYQAEDEIFKLAAYLKAKQMAVAAGVSLPSQDAAQHVRKWFPYFDAGTSGTLKLIGRTALPFLGFYRESIRIFGHALKERPIALAAGLAVPSIITALSAMALGLDADDLDEIQKDMRGKAGKLLGPTPLEGMPLFSMLLPVRSDTGQVQQFDISAVHPFVDFLGNRVESSNQEDWWQKTLRSFIAAGPIGSLLYSQMTGRDAFGDRPFVEANMTGGEKTLARLENAWMTAVPPLAGTGLRTLLNSGERSTNKTLEERSPTQAAVRVLGGLDVRNATPDLYRLADDWRKAKGYEVTEGMDYGSTTPASRARKALFAQLAQDQPNLTAIGNILKSLDKMGHPVRTEQDINRLLFYRDPMKLIGGNKAKGITPADAQAQFRASLQGEARAAFEKALQEYRRIQQRAPLLVRQAASL